MFINLHCLQIFMPSVRISKFTHDVIKKMLIDLQFKSIEDTIAFGLDYFLSSFVKQNKMVIEFKICKRTNIEKNPNNPKNHIISVQIIDAENRWDCDQIIEKDAIVIPDQTITIQFSYPLTNPTQMQFTALNGFSRLELLKCIYAGYSSIYKQESNTMTKIDSNVPLHNRGRSDGKYGIWGHELKDLCIEGIVYSNDTHIVSLNIGS